MLYKKNSSTVHIIPSSRLDYLTVFSFRRISGSLIFFFLFLFSSQLSFAQQIAFPGAEGFGKYATGGRGGKVVRVTSLEDSGPGSLRNALQAYPGEPLTIVFGISGMIELQSELIIKRSNLTIAGQTAPGEGICLKGHSLIINGAAKGGNHGNIIVRFIRSRPGGTDRKGLYGLDMENSHDVIIDHCSFSWANEECAALYDTKNTTVQWCIVSEGLYNAGHTKGNRSYGGVWGGQYASYHHNLIAHQNSRAVRFNGSRAHDTVALVDYRNNVVYNWGSENAAYGGDVKINGGVSRVNMINNYYLPGPATPRKLKFMHVLYEPQGVGQWYLSGNVMDGNRSVSKRNLEGIDLSRVPGDLREKALVATPFPISASIPPESAEESFRSVLKYAGAIFPKRDAVDERIIREVRTGKASGSGSSGKAGIIDRPEDAGGWPVYQNGSSILDSDEDGMPDKWEEENGLDPKDPSDRNGKGKDGYTMLEIYLNSLVSTLPG